MLCSQLFCRFEIFHIRLLGGGGGGVEINLTVGIFHLVQHLSCCKSGFLSSVECSIYATETLSDLE